MNLMLIKSGAQLIAGFGAGLIADNALKMVTPTAVKGLKGVALKVGAGVLSMMVADKASEYLGDCWDKTTNDIKEFMQPKKDDTEEEENLEEQKETLNS